MFHSTLYDSAVHLNANKKNLPFFFLISLSFLQVNLRRKRTAFPNWSSWTLWASCAASTWSWTKRIWSRWSFCCWRLLAGICACPHLPTSSTTTSTPRCRRATCTTAGHCPPSPRPRLSWTNTLTTSWKCPCRVSLELEVEKQMSKILCPPFVPRYIYTV